MEWVEELHLDKGSAVPPSQEQAGSHPWCDSLTFERVLTVLSSQGNHYDNVVSPVMQTTPQKKAQSMFSEVNGV